MLLCTQCPKTFPDKKKLRDHQRYHVMVECICVICKKIISIQANGQWDGNQLKSIVQEKNLNKMEKILPKEVQPFTESLRNLRKVYKTVCSSNIDESDDSDDLNKRKKKKIENVTEDSLSKVEKLEKNKKIKSVLMM